MRVARVIFLILFAFVLAISLAAQQTASSNPQALSLLQRSLSALSGSQSVTDVTLSGTARRIAGSDDETGNVVLRALVSGTGRADLDFPSGHHSEICNLEANIPAGAWSGPDRVTHAIALHNLFSEPAWFFPTLAIARRLSKPGYVATYVGREAREGKVVEHISISQSPPRPNPRSHVSFEHLTQIDLFIDSNTFLPVAITFNTHPDDDALVDILFEGRFSDYRMVNGAQVPYHVQKYLNNGLVLDFQADTVTVNSGLSASAFTVQ